MSHIDRYDPAAEVHYTVDDDAPRTLYDRCEDAEQYFAEACLLGLSPDADDGDAQPDNRIAHAVRDLLEALEAMPEWRHLRMELRDAKRRRAGRI